MTRIYIENNELDITQELTHQLTFAIDDLQNIDSKATSFSKTIIIPGTARNNQLFGNIFEFSNSNFTDDTNPNVYYNFNASKSAQARIEINGLQAMKGVMRLLSIIVDGRNVEYEIALFGEFGGFVSRILNKKLEDIDFSYLNHTWDYQTIVDSWDGLINYSISAGEFTARNGRLLINGDNLPKLKIGDTITISGTSSNDGNKTIINLTRGTASIPFIQLQFAQGVTNEVAFGFTIQLITNELAGFTYPLINYGNVTYDYPSNAPIFEKHKDYTFKAFRPAIFVLEYINQIITGAGYTWQSIFFNTDFFKRLIIPNNGLSLERPGFDTYISADTQETIVRGANSGYQIINLNWDNQPTLQDFTYNTSTEIFSFTGTTSRSIKLTATFIGDFTASFDASFQVTLEKTDGTILGQQSLSRVVQSNPQSFNFRLEATTVINANGGIIAKLYADNDTSSSFNFSFDATLSVVSDPPSFIPYDYGDSINMNDTIPRNIYQKDFFTSVLKLFNLMVVEDKFKERHLIIEPYVDFFQLDRGTYLDWSDKVNRDKPITIKPMAEANARIYEFKYKQDNDYFNEEYRKKFNESYGNRTFDNQLEFSKDSQSLEVIFSSSVLTGYPGFDKVVPAIYKKNNDVEEGIAHNIRIMQCKKITGVNDWTITVNNTSAGPVLDSYLYAGHFNDPDFPTSDLNFGATKELKFELLQGALQNNIFNAFYSSYMAEIIDKDSRIVTCEMYLTERDIFNLDFSRFILFDGVLYRIEKIMDWSETNLCKVELLRVINTTYQPQMPYFDLVNICSQYWSKRNLAKMTYNNGDNIPIAYSLAEWNAFGSQKIGCCAFYDFKNISTITSYEYGFGLYYSWWAVTDPRGLAPQGYRVPTEADFLTLKDCPPSVDDLKEAGTAHWLAGNTGTNDSGFNAYGGGFIDTSVGFDRFLNEGYFWTSYNVGVPPTGKALRLKYDDNSFTIINESNLIIGYNVRLIKE